MELKEFYNNENDINYDNTCMIYSKIICSDKVVLWNNKFINLKEIVYNQEIGNKKYMKKLFGEKLE